MKRLFALMIAMVSLIALWGCGENDGAPEGMQLVGGGEELGYYFYAPEQWTTSNLNGIDVVYVSNVDSSSVSFAEIDPSVFNKKDGAISDATYFFESYFKDSLAEFPEDTEVVNEEGEDALFGDPAAKADRAKRYVMSYKYGENSFRFMQIFISYGERFYIFTYSANVDKKNEDDITAYDKHLDEITTIIESFRFTEKKPAENADKSEFEKDKDGFLLISDKELCGFELYVPEEFELDYASGIVSATHNDGSNITLTKTTAAGIRIDEYYKLRKEELEVIVDDLCELEVTKLTALGNSKNAAAYEYTYVYNGTKYHVYQIFAVYGMSGYTFTFTATDENYAKHTDDMNAVIGKVVF